MVKKPILTDDELDSGLPSSGAVPPPPPPPFEGGAATRPVDGAVSPPPLPPPAPSRGDNASTRMVTDGDVPPPPPPPMPPAQGDITRVLDDDVPPPPPPPAPMGGQGQGMRMVPDEDPPTVPPSNDPSTRLVADDGAVPPPPMPPSGKARLVDDPDAPTAPEPPAPGRDAAGHARPKTRIHGYGGADRAQADASAADAAPVVAPVVGWLVVVQGPGRGSAVQLMSGMNGIGRDPENRACLDFGDDTISRAAHAFVTYDDEGRSFHLSHAGQTNVIRLNGDLVLAPTPLSHGDMIRIGATTLRFVALCGPDFDWSDA